MRNNPLYQSSLFQSSLFQSSLFQSSKAILASVGFLLFSSFALAQTDIPAAPQAKNYIDDSVFVRITDRGQSYFDKNFQSILFSLGFDIREGQFDSQTVHMDPINLDELKELDPEKAELLMNIREVFAKYFVGPKLQDHRLKIRLGNSIYRAQIKKLGLIADREALAKLGKSTGAILKIQLEIPKLTLAMKDIIVNDVNNPWLGDFGLNSPQMTIGSADAPIAIQVPLYVYVDSKGKLQFESQKMTHNISEVPLDIAFKDLIIPQIKIVINGTELTLNMPELEKLLREQLPPLVGEVRGFVDQWIEKDLPAQLSKMAEEMLSNSIEQTSSIPSIALTHSGPNPHLVWGIRLTRMNQADQFDLWLKSYLEDPTNKSQIPLIDQEKSKKLVNLNHLKSSEYDVGIGVSAAILNRMARLSFLRGNFNKIPFGKGNEVKVLENPTLELVNTPTTDGSIIVRMKAKLELKVGGSNASFFKNGLLKLQGSILLKVKPSPNREAFELSFFQVPESEIVLDNSSILGIFLGLGKGIVGSQVLSQIRDQNQVWATQPDEAKIDSTIPLPVLLGINFKMKRLAVDPNSFIVLYTEYKKN
ncbi:MAG: hypothetical protein ACK5P5_00520 [Pseudobdellovibrionaceae bacterium]